MKTVVAVRTRRIMLPIGHKHVIGVKLEDDSEEDAADVGAAIEQGEKYRMVGAMIGPRLLRVQHCPACGEKVLYA